MYENAVVKNYREHRELLHFSVSSVLRNKEKTFKKEEEKVFSHIVAHLTEIGILTASREDEYSTSEVITSSF
jgi:hypothetical protein